MSSPTISAAMVWVIYVTCILYNTFIVKTKGIFVLFFLYSQTIHQQTELIIQEAIMIFILLSFLYVI